MGSFSMAAKVRTKATATFAARNAMRISWNWLRTLLDTDLTAQEAAAVLTSTGLEVESVDAVEPVKGMLAGVVVGHVLERAKHPDADRLSVCRVDVGSGEPLNIVCGAPNVAAGQKVLVATVGTTLHPVSGEPLIIKRSKIRGVESQGMICAEDELGIGEGHAGIMILDPAARVGSPAAEQLGLTGDLALEIGLTPNRADAMSHAGVARDLAAALQVRRSLDARVKWPDVSRFQEGEGTHAIAVEVLAQEACVRYAGVTLINVKVGPSPVWLQDRLKSIGLKPINNVVDVTNFVQHEIGQPLHAFDADKLAGGRIVVRMAHQNEPFKTLDGRDRVLDPQDLVIADGEAPACIAGVFGGAHSGVSEATSTVFLESACFDPGTIRRTARRHQLNTDASFRFERGVDPEITVYALKRAVLLLQEVAGATISSRLTDLIPVEAEWKRVVVRFTRVDMLIGTPIAPAEVERVLKAIGCRVVSKDEAALVVDVPPFRVDVTREVDLIEEVIRTIGFDRVPTPERLMVPAMGKEEVTPDGALQRIAMHFAARGFREVMTPSLVNATRAVELNAATPEALVRVKNPLSAELDAMRPTMLFGLLQTAAHNIARQQRDLRLFETGRVYGLKDDRTMEAERIGLLLTGRRWKEQWRAEDRKVDADDIKEEVELLLGRWGIRDTGVIRSNMPLLSDGMSIMMGGNLLATIGTVSTGVLRAFAIDQPCYFAEVDAATLHGVLRHNKVTYAEVPRFPAVRRDLSLLLDKSVTFAQLEKLARQSERKLLRAVDLFDVYEGDKLPAGKKSYALSFTLQDPERTLTDEQVEKAMGRIRTALEKEAGAVLRG